MSRYTSEIRARVRKGVSEAGQENAERSAQKDMPTQTQNPEMTGHRHDRRLIRLPCTPHVTVADHAQESASV